MTDLSEFSRMLEEQFKRDKEKRHQYALEVAAQLSQMIAELESKTTEELFEIYDTALDGTHSNYELMAVMMTYKGAAKELILKRTRA